MKNLVISLPESRPFGGLSIPQSAFRNPQLAVDAIQAAIEQLPQAELSLTHRFTPGMYIRTLRVPKGALVVGKIHRTEHPFAVTRGRCTVWDAQNGMLEICAGHIGVTKPGARRVLYAHEDTEWTTFHATDKTTPEAVEADIIEPHDFDREEALKLLRSSLTSVGSNFSGDLPGNVLPPENQSELTFAATPRQS